MTTTIAAIATPLGQGGVSIIRLSGDKAYQIGCAMTGKDKLVERYAHFAYLYDACGQVIDEAVVIYFKAPHSFTGEDVIEIQGHGGVVLPRLILARCFELGAVQATAGEFSYRAFENDKMDLLQAEAISDAISAISEAEARSAIRSLSGEFSNKINILNDNITQIRLYVEAMIDFSDEEDVDFLADGQIIARLNDIIAQLQQILIGAHQGVLLKNGVNVVLAGKPNAGKSSLLNTLAGSERAIVTDVAGTTRDTLQETIVLKGLSIHLTDTAGLRQTNDKVEQIGIYRAKTAIEQADILLLVYDLSEESVLQDLGIELLGNEAYQAAQDKLLVVGNKVDLTRLPVGLIESSPTQVNVSCETKAGIDDLIDVLCQKVGFYPNDSSIIARTRHVDALKRALIFIEEAKQQLQIYQASELSAESLKLAHKALGELTGQMSADDLLGKIFGQFCIGK